MTKQMRSLPLLCAALFMVLVFISCDGDNPSSPEIHDTWTWISGSDIADQNGTCDLIGKFIPANQPGARYGSVSWTDKDGNLWLFGGYGFDQYGKKCDLNCMWKYDTKSGMWAWMSGSPCEGGYISYGEIGEPYGKNMPGARDGSVSWTDKDGNLWLFGGWGFDSTETEGCLNDLWKYDTVTGMWTWISGSDIVSQNGNYGTKCIPAYSNVPGARYGSVSWTDKDGNLWLFGGLGYASEGTGYLNDLWKYHIGTGIWTWVSGSDTCIHCAVYGTMGEAHPDNVPDSNSSSISWTDKDGNLWLFGGSWRDAYDNRYRNNTLWKYDIGAGMWTWVSGSENLNTTGVYGEKGVADSSNLPGARERSVSWTDSEGNLWLFGGYGYASEGYGHLNDLWKYDTTSDMWTWISGSDTIRQNGTYGTIGTSGPANVPGARECSVSWTDSEGNLWLFGGYGYASEGSGYLNDLWKYNM